MIGVADVEVWIARTDHVAEREAAALAAICVPEEHARAARLPRPDQRRRWLVTRGAVRALLAGYLGIAPERVALRRDAAGKPRLERPYGYLRFSVSHARDLAAVGVAVGREVGVDVEARDAALDVDAIVRRFFPPEEAGRLLALPPAARRVAFFRSWSRREAVVKADGRGLRHPLHGLRVPAREAPSRAPLSVPGDARWAVADVGAPDGYVAAVAAAGGDWRPVLRAWIPGITRARPLLIKPGADRLSPTARPMEARCTR